MASAIDATKPNAGHALTADVRANFAAAKAEIEALQGGFVVQRSTEVNVADYVTAAQLADARAGTLSFNADVPINAAIAAANAISSYTEGRSIVNVRVPGGKWKLAALVNVLAHVNLICDGVLFNGLASSVTACVVFKQKSHCERLVIDGNSQSGVTFGEAGVANDMRIGVVKILNAGKAVNQFGVRFLGNNFDFDSIDIEGGYWGIDFGDGAGNVASYIRGRTARVYSADTGMRSLGVSSYLCISQVRIDSCNTFGITLDGASDCTLPDVEVFFTDGAPGTCYASGYAIDIGNNSGATTLYRGKMRVKVNNTGSVALRIANMQLWNLQVDAPAATGAHALIGSIAYAAGLGFGIDITLNSALFPTGTIAGRLTHYDNANLLYTRGGATLEQAFATPLNFYHPIDNVPIGRILSLASYRKGADQNIATNTTLQADNDLVLPIRAGETWQATIQLDAGALLSTTGIKLGATGPAGSTITIVASILPDVYAAANAGTKRNSGAAAASVDFTAAAQVGVANAQILVHIYITNPTNAGNLQFQFAQSTNSATNVTLRAGSSLRAWKVA